MVQGLGLTKAELMLTRFSAIKYTSKHDKQAKLIDLMLRFGLDFLTITPLGSEQLEALMATSTRHCHLGRKPQFITTSRHDQVVDKEVNNVWRLLVAESARRGEQRLFTDQQIRQADTRSTGPQA